MSSTTPMPLHMRTPALSLLLVLFWAGHASAQMFVSTGRDTLRGLPGVEVLVEDVPAELRQGDLATATLRAAVEQRLRAGGVTVYGSHSANPSTAKAYLYVQLTALPLPGSVHAAAIQVHLRQTVRSSVTESNIVNAMTWDVHTIAAMKTGEGPLLRDLILEMVGQFVDDWRAVH